MKLGYVFGKIRCYISNFQAGRSEVSLYQMQNVIKISVEIVFKYEGAESFPQGYAAPVSTATGADTRPFVTPTDKVLTNPNTGH